MGTTDTRHLRPRSEFECRRAPKSRQRPDRGVEGPAARNHTAFLDANARDAGIALAGHGHKPSRLGQLSEKRLGNLVHRPADQDHIIRSILWITGLQYSLDDRHVVEAS